MESQVKHAVRSPSPKLQSVSAATPVAPDAPVAPASATVLTLPTVPQNAGLASRQAKFPQNLVRTLGLILGQNGVAYAVTSGTGNPYALPVGSRQLNNVIRQLAQDEAVKLRKADINDINNSLQAQAEIAGITRNVWNRVAPVAGGVEIDLGDEKHTRLRVTAGKVDVVSHDSDTVFYRTAVTQRFVMPAEAGNIGLLKKYVNADAASALLLTAWLSFTLAHPKVSTTNYVILVLQGNEGSGKSALSKNVIQQLIDPCLVGVQMLPTNERDLAVIAQNAHLLCFDNVREFKRSVADILCVASTGGAISSRQLFTDADQHVLQLHVAMVLNGIHSFIDQPDLAQRCLPIHLRPIPKNQRKLEAELVREFQADAPAIFRGLLDLIAQVFTYLPTAKATHPERMMDFVLWLAAMEEAAGIPAGTYQSAYSEALNQGQRDGLQENALASAIVEFAEHIDDFWTGTPSDLLIKLNKSVSAGTLRSRDWPQNAIALSKRLVPLQASLQSQGIKVELHRGKFRTITISV
jgi:hypothetical protein